MKLAINICPHGIYSVSIDDESGGVRLTPSKCCGRWTIVQEWPLTHQRGAEIVNEIQCEIADLES